MSKSEPRWWDPANAAYDKLQSCELLRLILEHVLDPNDLESPDFGGYIYGDIEDAVLYAMQTRWIENGRFGMRERLFQLDCDAFTLGFRISPAHDALPLAKRVSVDYVTGFEDFKFWCSQLYLRTALYGDPD